MAETYYDLLRRPEWQKKRLVVMERADFRCEECDADKVTLNVHHKLYRKGAKPWEYEDSELVCLCEPCHQQRHAVHDAIKYGMSRLTSADLYRLAGYVGGLMLQGSAGPDTETSVTLPVPAWEFAAGLADAYGIVGAAGADRVIDGLDADGRVCHAILNAIYRGQQEAKAPQ